MTPIACSEIEESCDLAFQLRDGHEQGEANWKRSRKGKNPSISTNVNICT